MKVLLLNLPHTTQIVRRYMCSYHSPGFLFPPLELISIAGMLRRVPQVEVMLHDAIAEKSNIQQVCSLIVDGGFSAVIALSGFECFESDMHLWGEIKKRTPHVRQILFGYYPTTFPEQLLRNTHTDFLLLGEPELPAYELFSQWQNGGSDYSNIIGIAYKTEDGACIVKSNQRITHFNELPMPAYDLLPISHYSEAFMKSPFGIIQTARGCPYKCNYCVRSYGTKLSTLSPENMVAHVEEYIRLFGVKSIRFIDDTFTATPARVVEFCKLLKQKKIEIEWACLSRADTLNKEMLHWMKKTGCIRLYIGAETGSQRMLDMYSKGVDRQLALQNLQYCKQIGLQTVGFFMVSGINESEDDLQQSIDFAIESDFDFIAVSELQTYPGTALFEQFKINIEFSLFPYVNRFKDAEIEKRQIEWQKKFYSRFYNRPSYLFKKIPMAVKYSRQALSGYLSLQWFSCALAKPSETRRDFI